MDIAEIIERIFNKMRGGKMKRIIIAFLIMGVTMIFYSCTENNPMKPELNQGDEVTNSLNKMSLPRLVGNMTLAFDPTRAPYFWQGTVNFRGGGVYVIRFESLGPPIDHGEYTTFSENFEIFELGNINELYLKGHDNGYIYNENSKTIANGEVAEANEPFEIWLGSYANFTGAGNIGPDGMPISFEGIFRIIKL